MAVVGSRGIHPHPKVLPAIADLHLPTSRSEGQISASAIRYTVWNFQIELKTPEEDRSGSGG